MYVYVYAENRSTNMWLSRSLFSLTVPRIFGELSELLNLYLPVDNVWAEQYVLWERYRERMSKLVSPTRVNGLQLQSSWWQQDFAFSLLFELGAVTTW